MTEQEAHSVVGAVAQVGNRLVSALPAQFLLLLLLVLLFLAGFLWFLDRRDEARERMITPVIAACLARVDK
jgi:uncharacterized membrane protein YfcA